MEGGSGQASILTFRAETTLGQREIDGTYLATEPLLFFPSFYFKPLQLLPLQSADAKLSVFLCLHSPSAISRSKIKTGYYQAAASGMVLVGVDSFLYT